MNGLTLALALVIGFSIMMYVVMDGFDLGIGILFPFIRKQESRLIALSSIAPIWDGNETWLVMGGTCLFAAFPKAYALILPALYLPLIIFLIGLILRGVAFEFSFKATTRQWLCYWLFSLGSILATFMQGVILGRFIEGFSIGTHEPLTLASQFISPFSIMVGIALLSGYALLGATWLIIKTEGDLQAWCYKQAFRLTLIVVLFIIIVSLWTPFKQAAIAERWFSFPNLIFLSPVPLYTGLITLALFWSLSRRHEFLPFLYSIGLFILSYIGLAISLWPYMIPRLFTIWEVAAPKASQVFILTGVLLLIPLILAYTAHAYWVFHGKVRLEDKYY
jgi:cytochrome bd ubiquinol oxidase subunit II